MTFEDNYMGPASIDHEAIASEKGWVPQDQWEGDPDQWRSAKEFVERGELMDRISSQSRQLGKYTSEVETLKKAVQEMAEHNKKIAEIEYNKAVQALRQQKADALDMGDHYSVVEIDDRLQELKEARKAEEQQAQPSSTANTPPPEVQAWMEENTWYNNDIILQGAADAIAKQYLSSNPQAANNPKEVLDFVATQVRKEFPDRLGGTRRRASGVVETSSTGASTSGKTKKYTVNHLNPEQRAIAKRFAATGVISEQEYVDQLAALGELG